MGRVVDGFGGGLGRLWEGFASCGKALMRLWGALGGSGMLCKGCGEAVGRLWRHVGGFERVCKALVRLWEALRGLEDALIRLWEGLGGSGRLWEGSGEALGRLWGLGGSGKALRRLSKGSKRLGTVLQGSGEALGGSGGGGCGEGLGRLWGGSGEALGGSGSGWGGEAEAPPGLSLPDGPLGLSLPDGPPGLSLPDGPEMRSLATPQKAKPPVVPEVVEGMVTDGVDAHGGNDDAAPSDTAPKSRKNMCTPDKNATPVKSPFHKKGRVGSVEKGKPNETADVDMVDVTSPVKCLTLEYDPDAAAAEFVTCLQCGLGGPCDGSDGHLRSLDSMSTIPDPELECKSFMKMLGETSNEDVLRKEILGWVNKRATYDVPGFEMLPPRISKQCRLVQELSEKALVLGHKQNSVEGAMHKKVDMFNKGYEKMLKQLQERHPDDQSSSGSMFSLKKVVLDRWLHDKMTDAMEPVKKIQLEINQAENDLSTAVGKVIQERVNCPPSELQLMSQGTQDIEDAVNKEVDKLMDKIAQLDTTGEAAVGLLRQKTLTLGEIPEDEDDAMEDSKEKVTQPVDDRDQTPGETENGGESKGDGLMRSDSSESVAMKHIGEMPDGPAKSALLAILEATVAKAVGPL
eukprot:s647_g22.t1